MSDRPSIGDVRRDDVGIDDVGIDDVRRDDVLFVLTG